ncbi:MAG: hypothetical protein CK532_07860 [Flavobacteriales bacterium]|nr:MAG: hypothetical protein CK532_07860 [Flavobacteriales bacterium]
MAGKGIGRIAEFRWFFSSQTAVQKIVSVCVLVFIPAFIFEHLNFQYFLRWFMFTPTIQGVYQPWGWITHIFLHTGFWHILGNMLWLFFVGTILEDLVGKRHIWWLFILGGVAGALFFQVYYLVSQYGVSNPNSYLLGASGGVSAVVLAAAIFTPRYRVFLFGIIQIELRWIGLMKIVLDVSGSFSGNNLGGYLAHFGGIFFGIFYAQWAIKGHTPKPILQIFNGVVEIFRQIFSFVKRKNPRFSFKNQISNTTNRKNQPNRYHSPSESEVNRLLEKISQVGYNSLTPKEKETLFKASQSNQP